jgi:hypothetical protein
MDVCNIVAIFDGVEPDFVCGTVNDTAFNATAG